MAALLVAVLLVLLPQLTPATEALSRQRLWVARYDGPAHRNDICAVGSERGLDRLEVMQDGSEAGIGELDQR